MAGESTEMQTLADPWECHWYGLILELTYGRNIMLRLTLVYLGVLGCLAGSL